MDNIRKIVRETLNKAYKGPDVIYSAVVIEDSTEEQKIRELAKKYIPEGWSEPIHYHMTISQGILPKSLRLRGDLNSEVELTLSMIGISEKAIAFGVMGYYSVNEMPHITVAFNQDVGGVPADSKDIQNWKPIDKVIVTGIVREIGPGNKILKENIKNKIKVDLMSEKIFIGNEIVGDFDISIKKEYMIIRGIEIYPEYRKQGYATDAMKQIIEYADSNNLILALSPSNYKGSNANKLIKWYKSLGFILNKGKKKDFQTMEMMYKLPNTLEEMLGYRTMQTTTSREAHAGITAQFPDQEDFDQFGNQIKDIK